MAKARTTDGADRRTDLEPVELATPVASLDRCGIPFLGPKIAAKLADAVGSHAGCPAAIATVEDLLSVVPLRYEDRSNLLRINELDNETDASIEVRVELSGGYPVAGGRFRIFEISGVDPTGKVRAFWWNQLYLANTFKTGARAILFGHWKRNRKGILEVENPEYEILPDDDDESATIHTGRRVPIYRKFGEFRTRPLRRMIFEILARIPEGAIEESLPAEIVGRRHLADRESALRGVHF
ncbi:MAG: hypothetical protein WBQ66_13365, partial [Blastocatellia bacterium]